VSFMIHYYLHRKVRMISELACDGTGSVLNALVD